MDYWHISRMQNAKPKVRSGHIFLRLMICGAVQYVQYYQAKTQQYDRNLRDCIWPCDELQQVVFWLYATFLFGGSVCSLLFVAHPGLQVRLVRASTAQNLAQEQAQAAARLLQTASF